MRNDRRRRVTYYRRRTKKKEGSPLKLVLLLLVICLSVGMKTARTGPLYDLRCKVTAVLQDHLDLSQAVETLGRTFSGREDGEESAILVFGKMILGLEEDQTGEKTPTQSGTLAPIVDSIDIHKAGDLSGLSFDIAESPRPLTDAEILSAMDTGIQEDALLDGTPNQSFEIPSPDIVDDAVYVMDMPTMLPLSGYRLTSPFGYRIHPISGNTTFHYGVDLAAPTGTKVVAAAAGTVTETGYGSINGNYIKVSHADGFVTHYTHLQSILVKKGDGVAKGEQIGTVGSTGYSTGPHLHFEVRKDGKVVDPTDYFAF
ncbi:MAG: M23 family metallopeptidase [Clostridia bacterium]|nr:M23 family metallopeptidase [Clostridia bacterium]